jgi:hypothetical protein
MQVNELSELVGKVATVMDKLSIHRRQTGALMCRNRVRDVELEPLQT